MKTTTLAALTLCAMPAHAATISGSMAFDIFSSDPDTGANTLVAQGFVDLHRNHILDFELNFNGYTWDTEDVDPCRCEAWGSRFLNLVSLAGGDAFGEFGLFFDLHPAHDNFGMSLTGGGLNFSGSLHGGTAGAHLTQFSLFRDVPEPSTLLMLALGLVGLAVGRRR